MKKLEMLALIAKFGPKAKWDQQETEKLIAADLKVESVGLDPVDFNRVKTAAEKQKK